MAIPLAAAPNPHFLISAVVLATHLTDPDFVILHVGSQKDYDAGHVPNARLVTLADLSVTGPGGLRLELPPTDQLVSALERLGITDATRHIVVYAGNESVQSATRVWFTLDYLGLGDRAALLDGGIAAWRAENHSISKDPAAPPKPGKLTVRPTPARVVDAAWLQAHKSAVHIVDARLPEFYNGANAGGMPRAGHIPDARNVPYTSLLRENGQLKSPQDLRALLNTGKAQRTVTYCHIGQQATVPYFVARYLGMEASLYDGSFQDWSQRKDLPVVSDAKVADAK
jgi:thiosulfate/3-mercaptopyruvate sulfurtransferase